MRFQGMRNCRASPSGDLTRPPAFQSTLSNDTAAMHAAGGVGICDAARIWWCPSIACMTGLRIDSCRLLIKAVAKVWGHAIAQQLLHGPYVVRQTCRHSRRNRLPLLG